MSNIFTDRSPKGVLEAVVGVAVGKLKDADR
jgi:hypothetical protein